MALYRDDPERVTFFAETDARGRRQRFGIKAKDRSRHMYVIGKTGMGKSTLLENMAIQDIQNGEGLAFIDPHGSTAERLLDYVPEDRIKDVLYLAPFDMDFPVAFNVMEDVGYDKRHLVVSGLMSAFQRIWEDAWSARMEYILSNTLLALLEYPDSTLLDVNRMLVQKSFRKKVVDFITDPLVKSFWVDEFANYTDRYTQEATPAIQNKIGQFTSNPLIRNIIGQPKSTFDLRKMMDERKILIVNLSKGRIGETNADLLGSMLTTKIYLSAMSRADLPEAGQAKLPNFYFYVDEFQSIANDSFADILSEARKYKLNLTIAHQYIEQMTENVRNAVFGNVGTTLAFRVGPFDAEVLEVVFKPQFLAADLVNLGKYQMYLTLMIDGVGSSPFSAVGMPLIPPPRLSYRDHIMEFTRKTYGRPRADVEKDISEHGKGDEVVKDSPKERTARSPRIEKHPAVPARPQAPAFSPLSTQVEPAQAPTAPPERTLPERHVRRTPRPSKVPSVRPALSKEQGVTLKEILSQKAQSKPNEASPMPQKAPDPRTQNLKKDPTPEHKEELRSALQNLVKKATQEQPKERSKAAPKAESKEKPQPFRSQEKTKPNAASSPPKAAPSPEVTPEELRDFLKVDGQ